MESSSDKSRLKLVAGSYAPGRLRHAASAKSPRSPYVAYYRRIEAYANRIRKTENVIEIIDILDQALTETRRLENADEDRTAPYNKHRAESEIRALKAELEQLRGLVHVDQLTGLMNRGGLQESFAREAARADRAGRELAVALLDLDDFKLINDRHGHAAGDQALVHLAAIIRNTMRPSDVVVRFGGEEFLFLLPDADAGQATRALQRVQDDLDRRPLHFSGQDLNLAFSAGIAMRRAGENREDVVARADSALYAAKRAGKRQVCRSSPANSGGSVTKT
jgi:diguanylate cyclase